MKEMKILSESIGVSDGYTPIHKLRFLKDNPRVYASTHGVHDFDNLPEQEQQEIIYKNLLKEPSVKNLLPEIKRHGGLIESILIRHDTMEVIEGNSRLAVYLKLHRESKENEEWEFIPCDIVSSLTDQQQAAFLSQIHVKGKTKWSAFEKANFAYVRVEKGEKKKNENLSDVAALFGESYATINTRYKAVKIMKGNKDSDHSHFSYYDVIVRNNEILKAIEKTHSFANLLADIKKFGSKEEENSFTAQDLRNKFPEVMGKEKWLKKYISGDLDLDEAYQRARPSDVERRVKQAKDLLEEISLDELIALENNEFNKFKIPFRKLLNRVGDLERMIKKIEKSK